MSIFNADDVKEIIYDIDSMTLVFIFYSPIVIKGYNRTSFTMSDVCFDKFSKINTNYLKSIDNKK